MFMQIVLHFFVATIGFFILGGTLVSFTIKLPAISPLWPLIFAPAAFVGGFFVNFIINR